jgi:hypothetical protein
MFLFYPDLAVLFGFGRAMSSAVQLNMSPPAGAGDADRFAFARSD